MSQNNDNELMNSLKPDVNTAFDALAEALNKLKDGSLPDNDKSKYHK